VWSTLKGMWQVRNHLRCTEGQRPLPFVVLIRTWENLLAGHRVLIAGRIVQLVVETGLVFLPLDEGGTP
jgi:hypothetical protein